jgi:hypothetical protein
VATPQAEAVVADQSEAVVSYDEGKREGRFSTYRGSMEVKTGAATRQVAALQSVRQTADTLSAVETLPGPPKLLRPEENADFDYDREKQMRLSWEEVPGGERYALQVSRNRLFVDNVIDVADRRSTGATLGIQGEGTFLWRVAAVAAGNVRGPWSAPGRFRVVSGRSGAGSGDKQPPELQVQSVQTYGSIFIVGGHTEPGATVTVNDESVTVQADGAFTKTIQLAASGWAFLDVKAVDASATRPPTAPGYSWKACNRAAPGRIQPIKQGALGARNAGTRTPCRCFPCSATSPMTWPSTWGPPTRWCSRAAAASSCASPRWW